jgi:phosphate/sulfate permease
MADAAGLFARGQALYRRGGGVNVPPGVLLSWPTPNTVNPEERGWESSIILMVAMGVTFLVFIGRMWARLVVAKNAGLDDILMSVAMLPVFGLTISAILGESKISFVGKTTNDMKLSECMASNGTHGISHRRVRSHPARYLHLIQACIVLFADGSDYYGNRA